MRETPYLAPATTRTVTQWAQYFAADPRDVAAAAQRLGWNLGAMPTVVTKLVFMNEVLPAPVIDWLQPPSAQPAAVTTGRMLLRVHGRGFTEASQVVLDADAEVDEDVPDSGPQLAPETQVLTSGELVCVLPPNAIGPYVVAVRTPYRKDSNHATIMISAGSPTEDERPPGVTLPEGPPELPQPLDWEKPF